MTTSNPKGTALITGASRGIGAVYADRLAKRGYDLILVARDGSRLVQLTAKLKRETGRIVTPLMADLSNRADLAKVEDVLKHNQSISLLLNNAGAASVAPLLNADIGKMDEIIALNITALTRLTYAAAPRAAWRVPIRVDPSRTWSQCAPAFGRDAGATPGTAGQDVRRLRPMDRTRAAAGFDLGP
jgi:short-subunit dehydrogenase